MDLNYGDKILTIKKNKLFIMNIFQIPVEELNEITLKK